MFIVSTKTGERFTERSPGDDGQPFYWDDIPNDVEITCLQLTLPFRVTIKSFEKREDNSLTEFSPKFSLKGFSRYFFYNEAVVTMEGRGSLEAKVAAGIDDDLGSVFEVRMDKYGNCSTTTYSLESLNEKIRAGLFRESIIKKGSK